VIPSSDAAVTGGRHARFFPVNSNGAPTVVLLLGEGTVVGPDIDVMVHNLRASLSSNVHLVVIAPQSAAYLTAEPGYTVTISTDVSRLARGFGVQELPGSLLLDGAGHVVWTSGRPGNASGEWEPDPPTVSGRTSGAVALGEIGTQGRVQDAQHFAPAESDEQAQVGDVGTCTDALVILDNSRTSG